MDYRDLLLRFVMSISDCYDMEEVGDRIEYLLNKIGNNFNWSFKEEELEALRIKMKNAGVNPLYEKD